MTIDEDLEVDITARLVVNDERARLMTELLGVKYSARFLARLDDWMRELCADYTGGCWHMYELSNGGFYMAPQDEGQLDLFNDCNNFEGTMSVDAAGLTATLLALHDLVHKAQLNTLADLYEHVFFFANAHQEGAAIMQAIQ